MFDELDFLKKNLSIGDAVSVINSLEDNQDKSNAGELVKWKSYAQQVVIESDNYFYKIYEFSPTSSKMFDHLVRENLAIVMQDEGIDWKLVTFERDGSIFDFEQRQKLVVANEVDHPFEDVLLGFSRIYDRLAQMFEFDSILEQLKEKDEFAGVEKLQLSRMSLNNHQDYALHNAKFYLLDDAEFFIAMLSSEGVALDVSFDSPIPVSTSNGEFSLVKIANISRKKEVNKFDIPSLDELTRGWALMPSEKVEAKKDHLDLSHDDSCGSQLTRIGDGVKTFSLAENRFTGIAESIKLRLSDFRVTSIENESNKLLDVRNIEKFMGNSNVLGSNLTDAAETELYDELEKMTQSNSNLLLCTQLNGNGRKIDDEALLVWKSHMRTISEFYPDVLKLTKIYLTQEFCELYLNGEFDVSDFSGRYTTAVAYFPPELPSSFPSRRTFRRFLASYVRKDVSTSNLFFPDAFLAEDVDEDNRKLCENNHPRFFRAYSDCDMCMKCDYEQIVKSAQQH